jgi:hypothetical protein
MRVVCFGVAGVLLVSGVTMGGSPRPDEAGRVRPMQAIGHKLIEHGLERSETFRQLVRNLEESDVIAYVDVRSDMTPDRLGATRFLTRSASHRFVRIMINRDTDWWTQIAMLGHELQHANEIAQAREIGSAEDLRAFYQRVGIRVSGRTFDSEAAQRSGKVVRSEIGGASTPLVAGRRISLDELLLRGGSIAAPAE